MNKLDYDVMKELYFDNSLTQREIAARIGCSLGAVNNSVKALTNYGFLSPSNSLTEKATQYISSHQPRNAVILAAGFGMRMVPINTEFPKGLLKIDGEPLIERVIKQLHEAGVFEIHIVVGFLKEKFEYLIDKYNVSFVVNSEYTVYNNLFSVSKVNDKICNSYIIPSDIWCENNPFSEFEPYSWYMVSDRETTSESVRINRKNEIIVNSPNTPGQSMAGIAYITEEDSTPLKERIKHFCSVPGYHDCFWEIALTQKGKMTVWAKEVSRNNVVEINTYEQLRDFRGQSDQLKSSAIGVIAEALGCDETEITDITVQKKGMTNRSFLFRCKGKKYIMRIPGEGTEKLINRQQEAATYKVISPTGICDNVKYINPTNGYKITEFYESSRCCDPLNKSDIKKCMDRLSAFHRMRLSVDHSFDLFKEINFYESLWDGNESVYVDYSDTKAKVLSLQGYIEKNISEKVLSHIDSVPDNFLFIPTADGAEEIKLIDWEYAGMQDPHIDIAMFAIYALYDREMVEFLIDSYFNGSCPDSVRTKIYCYISACGLLWSNWCEYKRMLGVEFGEYSLRQYRYAKEYYKIAKSYAEHRGILL